MKNKEKKPSLQAKQIHVSEFCINQLSHDAIDKGTDFKNHAQFILEEEAKKSLTKKTKTK